MLKQLPDAWQSGDMKPDATWVYLVITVLSWVTAFLAARHLQEGEHRRQQLGLVRLLRVELGRIKLELSLHDPGLLDLPAGGARPRIPQVHPWVQAVIAQVAPTSPRVISDFMAIERLLVNLEGAVGQRDGYQDSVNGLRSEIEGQQATHGPIWHSEKRQLLRHREEALERAQSRVDRVYEYIALALTDSAESLTEAATSLMANSPKRAWQRARERLVPVRRKVSAAVGRLQPKRLWNRWRV